MGCDLFQVPLVGIEKVFGFPRAQFVGKIHVKRYFRELDIGYKFLRLEGIRLGEKCALDAQRLSAFCP